MDKIKEILSNIGSYIIFGVFLLGCIILYAGIDSNIYFVWIGLLILLPFVIWFLFLKFKSNKKEKENEIERLKLIHTGDKVVVNLDEVEIKNNSWKHEITKGAGYQKRIEQVAINYNYIELEIPYHEQIIKYNLHIDMELSKLKMHFAIKQKTFLYVDRNNINNNYLDLSFLEN